MIQALVSMRHDARLTQMQLARKLNREQNFVARTELGERRLDVIEFWEYCRACEANPNKIACVIFDQFED